MRLLTLLACLAATSALARNTQLLDYTNEGVNPNQAPGEAKEWTGFAAAGVLTTPEYDGADSYQLIPALAGQANYGNYYVALRGLQATANIVDSNTWNAGPMAQFRFGRDNDVDNARIARLRPLDDALELGGFVSWISRNNLKPGDNFEVVVELLQDVADGHGGMLGEIGATYFTPITEKLRGSVSGFLNYQSQDYMDAYFSIDANNAARSGLRPYQADSGFNSFSLGSQLLYSLDSNWGLVGVLNYTRFIGDAADSPIIDQGNANQLLGVAGVTYRF
jgi:MipA family protein